MEFRPAGSSESDAEPPSATRAAAVAASRERTSLRLRERLAYECERRRPFKDGEVEIDESYFGRRRVPGKRGRGAGGSA